MKLIRINFHTLQCIKYTTYGKVNGYTSFAMELWNKLLVELSLGNEEIRENKPSVIMQRFSSFEMIPSRGGNRSSRARP